MLIAPDKFKGCLPAVDVANALADGILSVAPDISVVVQPVADGGEGTVDAVLSAGYRPVTCWVTGPTRKRVLARYAMRGATAVVEFAQAAGLELVRPDTTTAVTATSFGVGELIRHAILRGAKTVLLGLGGSATTDGGAGLLCALGARLLDAAGAEISPAGGGRSLARVDTVDLSGVWPVIAGVEFVVATDVDNPLLGPAGAAAVFAPQKGAGAAEVDELDRALTRLSDAVARAMAIDTRDLPGAGAAGGVGFVAMAVLGARRVSGAEHILEMVGFSDQAAESDLVVTGEGRLDFQTLSGKAPIVVARCALLMRVRTIVVAGRVALDEAALAAAGFARSFSLSDYEPDERKSIADAARLLRLIGEDVARVAALSSTRPVDL